MFCLGSLGGRDVLYPISIYRQKVSAVYGSFVACELRASNGAPSTLYYFLTYASLIVVGFVLFAILRQEGVKRCCVYAHLGALFPTSKIRNPRYYNYQGGCL